MIQNQTKQKISVHAISLEKFGIRDFAWEKESVKKLINSLMFDDIGILGGDVYQIEAKRLIPTYDNWSCESKEGELRKDYFLRSKATALSYINNYLFDSNEEILFSLVFTEILD